MFSAGIGQVDDVLTEKMKPSKGMKVVKIGGPAYRIGMGGGAASSQPVNQPFQSNLILSLMLSYSKFKVFLNYHINFKFIGFVRIF